MDYKTLSVTEYKELGDEIVELLASDETVDRDRDVIMASGWNVENWLKSGSVLYGHNPSALPIGSAESARVENGKLYLYTRFAKKGTSEWHDTIRSLIEQKILKGVSVGFKTDEYEQNEEGGRNFIKNELLEVSLTPVPANPNAMVVLRSMNIEQDTKEALLVDKEARRLYLDKYVEEEEKRKPAPVEEEAQDVEPNEKDEAISNFMKLYRILKGEY